MKEMKIINLPFLISFVSNSERIEIEIVEAYDPTRVTMCFAIANYILQRLLSIIVLLTDFMIIRFRRYNITVANVV